MAQVTVKINGYAYTVGCEDGQEPHLLAMAGQVESRIDSIKALGGNTGETRLLVLASLLMADELHDMRAELETLRGNAARAAKRPATAELKSAEPKLGETKLGESRPAGPDPEVARRLGRLAQRAEQLAASLEQPAG